MAIQDDKLKEEGGGFFFELKQFFGETPAERRFSLVTGILFVVAIGLALVV